MLLQVLKITKLLKMSQMGGFSMAVLAIIRNKIFG